MTVFLFAYWYEPDAPRDPVGLVRLWTLARWLSRSGDQVTVFVPRYRSAEGHTGFRTVAIPLLPWRVLRPLSYAVGSFVRGLLAGLRRRPDVVHYRWMGSPHPLVLARILGSLSVCELHGEPVPDWTGDSPAKRAIQHRLARFALRRCDRLIVITPGLRDYLARWYRTAADRMFVMSGGTDTELFSPRERLDCRRRHGLSPDADYVGFVGTFYRYQGLSCLLEAMAIIRESRPSCKLLLVGDGEAAQELRDQAGRLGLAEAVIWTGRVPYQDVAELIGITDVCVAPFTADRGETSPVKIFDYLACGRPVVASAIPSVSQIMGREQGVVLVPPDQAKELAAALLRLLADPEEARRLGRQGRQFVEQCCTWPVLMERLRDYLQEGLASAARRQAGVVR
jgi:glycosyltransferase involved in cell wall biosynthesis